MQYTIVSKKLNKYCETFISSYCPFEGVGLRGLEPRTSTLSV